jgi:alginate production protein
MITSTMQARPRGAIPMLLVLALGAALPLPVPAQDLTAGTKIKGALYGEDARDLGMGGDEQFEERSASYIELNPYLHLQFGEQAALYVRAQLFAAAGDEVVQNENELPVASDQYAAMRELWLEFGGPTSFPGEVIRLGRQRVREQDGLWWDRDVESLRWIFDTTLVQAQVGVAEQFGTWRSDDVELSPSQRDRAYVFATMTRQWQPGHFYGLRAAYAQDHADLPGAGESIEADTKTKKRDYLWVALRSENGYYDPRNARGATYWFEAIALAGRRESASGGDPNDPIAPGDPATVSEVNEHDVSALAGDMGLRFRLPLIFPFNVGAMAAFAQGERAGDQSHVFEQTGLESNRSRFTGTRTLLNRFNEALAADFSNLLATSAFMSMPYEFADFSLVYSRFQRHEGDVAFTADGIDVQPVTNSRDIGTGIDFVATRFFRDFGSQAAGEDEDQRSNVRLRASRFDPGAAYGGEVKDQYKVALELTLWF